MGDGAAWTPAEPTAAKVDSGMEDSAVTIWLSAAPDGPVVVFLPPPARRTATRPPTMTMTTTTAPTASRSRRRRSARC